MPAINHPSARMNAFISLAFGAVILATSPAGTGVGWDRAGAFGPEVGWDKVAVGWDLAPAHDPGVGWDNVAAGAPDVGWDSAGADRTDVGWDLAPAHDPGVGWDRKPRTDNVGDVGWD
ncbi:hypothetical protein B7755_015915 [Streptomyces sp. NBS 14/10]|uniref:hypothetical protein n=1 Tax=Streptomyces sp. NBS 14/10 TaxID=1945643 RepID=UPI000B7F5F7C|nr:hypothetical protein [Streptomyces sp. NBS 14/10]KAK1179499.1 hypothetical protein B7755_015915 [Streptomyces sp. NBS 14/10]